MKRWGSFFFLARKERLRQNLLCSHKYGLIFGTIYIFQTKILEYSCLLFVWQLLFHLIVNDTLKQQTTALNGLHAIICLIQTDILRWNGVPVFVVVVENVRKCLNNAAFSNIQKLFSEPVNTIWFAMKHTQSNEINKYLKIYVEITVLYTIEMLSILQSSFRSSSSLFTENASDIRWFRTGGERGGYWLIIISRHCLVINGNFGR